jgi:hypothetical protein
MKEQNGFGFVLNAQKNIHDKNEEMANIFVESAKPH